MFRLIFQFLTLCAFLCEINCQNPQVVIPQGSLLGDLRNNIDEGIYYSFQSIPYAKPPIGALRFKAPQPAEPWEGIRNATQDLPSCVQSGNTGGQEDCLYLNVYTPGLPQENVTELPVMVWIHGGGFRSGSATESMYGAQFLLTKDVILVTINYRLGIFGFLSLDDSSLGVTGNAGMKDQVLALEWVRDNIQFFGGNPKNVLIFGESAGSMSVQYHILSSMSNGLFHKAISQSGDPLTELTLSVTRNTALPIAEILGIQTNNWEDMLLSLQEASAADLALAEASIDLGIYRMFSVPIVEIPSNGTTFLDRRPIDIIRSDTYNKVPFMIGVNDAEGFLFQKWAVQSTGESLFINDFTEFVPEEFEVAGTPLENLIGQAIRQFYYGNEEPNRDNATIAVNLTTDYFFAFSSYRTVREYLRNAENSIYFYFFTAVTDLNISRYASYLWPFYPAVSHGDDIMYLFHTYFTPVIEDGSDEELGVRNMVNLWTNFAIYGNPTPEEFSNFTWAPVTEEQFNYLHIGTKGSHTVYNSVFTPERMEFWWSLFEQYGNS